MRLTTRLAAHVALAAAIAIASSFALAGVLLVGQARDAEGREAAARMAGVREELVANGEALGLSAAALGQLSMALFSGNASNGSSAGSDPAFAAALFQAHDIDAIFFAWDPAVNASALMAGGGQSQQPTMPLRLRDGILGFGLAANGTMQQVDAALEDAVLALRLDLVPPFAVVSDAVRSDGQVWSVGAVGLGGLFPGVPVSMSLVAGRHIDAGHIASLETGSGLDLRLEPPRPGAADDGVRLDRDGWDELQARSDLPDARGQAVATLVAREDRVVFRQALESMAVYFLAILLVCGVLLAVGLLLLHRKVSGPLVRLEERMRDVAAKAAASHGTPAPPDRAGDEVGRLGRQFDAMLAALEARARQLEDSNRALQDFAAVVSHDLKNPLSTFRLNLHLLAGRAEAERDEANLERVRRMESSVQRMEGRIDGLLAYAKARGRAPPLGPIAVGPVVDGVLQDLAADLRRHHAQVEVAGDLPTVLAEPAGLGQVLQNLLANALKFHKPGKPPQVQVSATRASDGWVVHIKDQGVGFAPDEAGHLFQPFSRLANAQGVEGQGIGLAACARLMERMGGRIEAVGRPGEGADFMLHLRDGGAAAAP